MTSTKVYLVDDDADFCRLALAVLESAGLTVCSFADPRTFLQKATPNGVACVVLDFRLPHLDGLELQRLLATRQCAWPLVFVTAAAEVSSVVRAMKSGALDVLEKPCTASRLLAAVQAALQSCQQCEQAAQAGRQADRLWHSLTDRESEVCERLVLGLDTAAVGRALGLAPKTIEYHRSRAYRKLGLQNVVQLTRLAHELPCRTSTSGLPPKLATTLPVAT